MFPGMTTKRLLSCWGFMAYASTCHHSLRIFVVGFYVLHNPAGSLLANYKGVFLTLLLISNFSMAVAQPGSAPWIEGCSPA